MSVIVNVNKTILFANSKNMMIRQVREITIIRHIPIITTCLIMPTCNIRYSLNITFIFQLILTCEHLTSL